MGVQKKRIDLANQTIGRLAVLKHVGRDKFGRALWECKCSCGAITTKSSMHLRRINYVQSCGCLRKEVTAKNYLTRRKYLGKYGFATKSSPIYNSWRAMISRCLDPQAVNFKWYGKRGIRVCSQWQDFGIFLADMGESWFPAARLHRKDPNGNYCKENCEWKEVHEHHIEHWNLRLKQSLLIV